MISQVFQKLISTVKLTAYSISHFNVRFMSAVPVTSDRRA